MAVIRISDKDLKYFNEIVDTLTTEYRKSSQAEVLHEAKLRFEKIDNIIAIITSKKTDRDKLTEIESIISE